MAITLMMVIGMTSAALTATEEAMVRSIPTIAAEMKAQQGVDEMQNSSIAQNAAAIAELKAAIGETPGATERKVTIQVDGNFAASGHDLSLVMNDKDNATILVRGDFGFADSGSAAAGSSVQNDALAMAGSSAKDNLAIPAGSFANAPPVANVATPGMLIPGGRGAIRDEFITVYVGSP